MSALVRIIKKADRSEYAGLHGNARLVAKWQPTLDRVHAIIEMLADTMQPLIGDDGKPMLDRDGTPAFMMERSQKALDMAKALALSMNAADKAFKMDAFLERDPAPEQEKQIESDLQINVTAEEMNW